MTDQYPKNVATREGIITNMCYTWDHSFGLTRDPNSNDAIDSILGYTDMERKALWRQMAQIFDNDIYPNLEFRFLIGNDQNENDA
jgi:hypothetical protein